MSKGLLHLLCTLLFLAACAEQPKTTFQTDVGQEGHGGDLAVTRLRTLLYLNILAQERNYAFGRFTFPITQILNEADVINWKIISRSDLGNQPWKWGVDEKGNEVLAVNRELMRTLPYGRLVSETSKLLWGFSGSDQLFLATNLRDTIYDTARATELFGSEKENTQKRVLNLFRRIQTCNPDTSRLSGPWLGKFRDARSELFEKTVKIEPHIRSIPLYATAKPLYETDLGGAQVDFLTQKSSSGHWSITQDTTRTAGWEKHPDLISAVLIHEYAHTLNLESLDTDYIYAFAGGYCL